MSLCHFLTLHKHTAPIRPFEFKGSRTEKMQQANGEAEHIESRAVMSNNTNLQRNEPTLLELFNCFELVVLDL